MPIRRAVFVSLGVFSLCGVAASAAGAPAAPAAPTPSAPPAAAAPAAPVAPAETPKVAPLPLPPPLSASTPAARIAGKTISVGELDAEAQAEMLKLRSQEYELRRRVLDDLIVRRLLEAEAASRGITVEELSRVEIEAKAAPVGTDEIRAFYEKNKERYGKETYDDAADYIRESMHEQKVFQRRMEYLKALRAKAGVELLIDAPRLPANVGDSPVKGPAGAPVTIVVFSDYQCPFCGRLEPTLRQIASRYGERVRIAYRDFPLPMHEFAMQASLAGLCARDQGKFWEMNERLFANQDKLKPEDLKTHARALGLDADRFGSCLDGETHREEVRRDVADGQRWGVGSTPSLFINGRPVVGAKPVESFSEIIDEELERSAPRPAPGTAQGTVAPAAPGAAPATGTGHS